MLLDRHIDNHYTKIAWTMVIIIFNRGKTRQKFSPDFDNTPFPDINTRVLNPLSRGAGPKERRIEWLQEQ